MSLTIDIDPNGRAHKPFEELRAVMLGMGQRFTERELRQLNYADLVLAAIANAGETACSIEDALAEKRRRRYRFETLNPRDRELCRRYLISQGMYCDITAAARMVDAPRWDDLTPRSQLWFKLNCLHNHIDAPQDRLHEALQLVKAVAEVSISMGLAEHLEHNLNTISQTFPDSLTSDEFRGGIGTLLEEVLVVQDEAERLVCQEEVVTDYRCTSDCYHAMGSPE